MSKIINNFNKGKRPSTNKIESVNNLCVKEMHEQSKVTKNIEKIGENIPDHT